MIPRKIKPKHPGFQRVRLPVDKQLVHLGTTQSGRRGLFTGNMMAMSLDEDTFHLLSKDRRALAAYALRMGFGLEC